MSSTKSLHRPVDDQDSSLPLTSPDGRSEHTPATLPELTESDRQRASERVAITAAVVHEAVRQEGEYELQRHPSALGWSGLAAGLSMGFSLVGKGLLDAYLPGAPWRPIVASFGYTIGFLIVVLGRQQLFTENTVTVILPLFAHPNRHTFLRVARLWAVVLAANVGGALAFATMLAHIDVFPPEVSHAFLTIGHEAVRSGFGPTFVRAIFAGWLIALMVWLLPGAAPTRLHLIVIITYIVALGAFSHVIAGAVDVFYLANSGGIPWPEVVTRFFAPTLLGNVLGGVALVSALNFAQVASQTLSEG